MQEELLVSLQASTKDNAYDERLESSFLHYINTQPIRVWWTRESLREAPLDVLTSMAAAWVKKVEAGSWCV